MGGGGWSSYILIRNLFAFISRLFLLCKNAVKSEEKDDDAIEGIREAKRLKASIFSLSFPTVFFPHSSDRRAHNRTTSRLLPGYCREPQRHGGWGGGEGVGLTLIGE